MIDNLIREQSDPRVPCTSMRVDKLIQAFRGLFLRKRDIIDHCESKALWGPIYDLGDILRVSTLLAFLGAPRRPSLALHPQIALHPPHGTRLDLRVAA